MATATAELDRFVRDALAQGQSRESIVRVLTDAGWSAAQAHDALSGWAETPFQVPAPRPRASMSARDAFLYLVLFVSVYVVTWNLASLLFNLIDAAIPDPAQRDALLAMSGSTRWSTAALVVAFPVFVWLRHVLDGEAVREPFRRLSPVRRWLTYLTLFIAAIVLLGDATILVYRFLGGELSARFVLKALVVVMLAGGIFGYYLREVRGEDGSPGRAWGLLFDGRRLLLATAVAIVASIVASFWVMGTPAQQRAVRMDAARVQDLQQLQQAIQQWYVEHARLPHSLQELARQPGAALSISDPQTGVGYRYTVEGSNRFLLCADFATDTGRDQRSARWADPGEWKHGIGPTCYKRPASVQAPSGRQ